MGYTIMIRSIREDASKPSGFRSEWTHEITASTKAAAASKASRWIRSSLAGENVSLTKSEVTETFAFWNVQ